MIHADPRTLKPWPFTPAEDRKALDRLQQDIDDLDVRPEQYDVDAQHDKGEW